MSNKNYYTVYIKYFWPFILLRIEISNFINTALSNIERMHTIEREREVCVCDFGI